MNRLLGILLMGLCLMHVASCGEGALTISVSPSSSTIDLGKTQQFTASVTGTSNIAVVWSVNGVAGGNSTVGTISSMGLYTAPAAIPNPNTVTVAAASAANSAKTASATVTVTHITVAISPRTASVGANATRQFVAKVQASGTTNAAVTWAVNGVTGGNSTVGRVSSSGLYTAPSATPSPNPVSVTATSTANPSIADTAKATVQGGRTSRTFVAVRHNPLPNVLSAEITISTVTMNTASGPSVTLLDKPSTIELSTLGAIGAPLAFGDAPEGVYSSITVVVGGATVSYLDPITKTPVISKLATISGGSTTIVLNPPLTVSIISADEIKLDFDLAKSFDIALDGTVTFTPVIAVGSSDIQSENADDKKLDIGGQVLAITTSSITLQDLESQAVFDFIVDTTTQFEDGVALNAIQVGAVLEVEAELQLDGTLLAKRVQSNEQGRSENNQLGQDSVEGMVVQITTDSTGALIRGRHYGGIERGACR